MRTIWALDVDGPINASKAGWGRAPSHRHVMGYRLAWEPELIDAIREIHTSELAEVMWCTTWCPDADLLENLWKLPRLSRAWDHYPEGNYVGDLKINTARKILADGNRLIWTDDTETPTPEIFPDLYRELTATGRALLIRPKPSRGLRPDDITDIKKFCMEGK